MQNLNEVVVGIVASVPLWALLLFFIYRTIKSRDSFEKKMELELIQIRAALNKLDKGQALIHKDIEHASNLSKAVSDLVSRVGKLKYDIDNYFQKFRELEGKISAIKTRN